MSPRIDIGRMPLTMIATTSRDRAERLERRLRDDVARCLPSAIAAACGAALDSSDRYVFIDRLHVDCAVNTQWSADTIARAFGERVGQALLQSVAAGGTLTFRDREEYVAAFINDLAGGRAASHWWFDEFSGLAPLPASAAIRTVIVDEGDTAIRSLARLTADTLHSVLRVLTASDAGRALAHIVSARRDSRVTLSTGALCRALNARHASDLPEDAQRQLARVVALEREEAGGATAGNLHGLQAVDALRRAARAGQLHGILKQARLPRAMLAECCRALGIRIDLPDSECAALTELLQKERASVRETPADALPTFAFTPYGGALLLAALLVRLAWWDRWRAGRNAQRDASYVAAAVNQLALALVARALDPDRPAVVEGDPVVRRVFGLDDRVAPGGSNRAIRRRMRRALAATHPVSKPRLSFEAQLERASATLLDEFSRRVPGCEGSTAAYLRAQCLALTAEVGCSKTSVEARLGRPPLDVLLRFAGLKRGAWALPDGRQLVLRDEATS